jgi:uncharacterized membrane protein
MKLTFSIQECLTFGWKTFTARPWFFVGVSLAYVVAHSVLGFMENHLPGIISFLISLVGGTLVSLGFLTIYLRAHDNLAGTELKDAWNPEAFWRYLVASIVVGLISLVGLVLLVIPGVIIGIVFGFAIYLSIEKKVWTLAALKESARITRGNRWTLFVLGLAICAMNIVGAILLLVGLLVTVPVSMLASIHAYRLLAARAGEVPQKKEETPEPDAPIEPALP